MLKEIINFLSHISIRNSVVCVSITVEFYVQSCLPVFTSLPRHCSCLWNWTTLQNSDGLVLKWWWR